MNGKPHKSATPTPKNKPGKNSVTPTLSVTKVNKEAELKKLSQVVRIEKCEEFNFEFEDADFEGRPLKNKISEAEGILINPRWAQYDFNPRT